MRLQVSLSAIFALTFAIQPLRAAMPPEAYDDAVAALEGAQVIEGYSAGNPRVYEYVNRAEALKIILLSRDALAPEVTKIKAKMPEIALFPDVDQRSWYAPYVEVGFKYGVIKGYPDGLLWPQAGVKVSEAAAMLARAYGEKADEAAFQSSDDLPNVEGQWYTGAVSILNQHNLVMPQSRLKLGAYITRGQLFDIVYRMRLATGQGRSVALEIPASQQISTIGQPVSQTTIGSIASSATSTTRIGNANPIVLSAADQKYLSSKPFALSIPSLNILDLAISHPEDATTQKGILAALKDGVGHLFGYPGDGGKVLVYGHSSSYPWDLSKYTKIFRGINKVNIGEKIYVTHQGKLHVYQVTEKRTVKANERSAFEPDDDGEELILYTCWPPDSITHRFLVIGKPIQEVAGR